VKNRNRFSKKIKKRRGGVLPCDLNFASTLSSTFNQLRAFIIFATGEIAASSSNIITILVAFIQS